MTHNTNPAAVAAIQDGHAPELPLYDPKQRPTPWHMDPVMSRVAGLQSAATLRFLTALPVQGTVSAVEGAWNSILAIIVYAVLRQAGAR